MRKVVDTLSTLILIFLIVALAGIVYANWRGYKFDQYVTFATDTIMVSGTGSMYPTFPKGKGTSVKELAEEVVGEVKMMRYPHGIFIFGRELFTYPIARGDIVSFENANTTKISIADTDSASGFIKRVIALPGDSVEIRDGQVIVNGQVKKEPYVARARSTFGGSTLSECRKIRIPKGKLFVMGDNRKASDDSRHELGLIDISDIDHVLPYAEQIKLYSHLWRDPSQDDEPTAKIKIDPDEYIRAINKKRQEAGLPELKNEPKLVASATLRAKDIMRNDDFSFEATRSGYTMQSAMRDAHYSNIVWGESIAQGYFDTAEFLDNQLHFAHSQEFISDARYDDIGVAAVQGEINGCPTQVIVQHLAGYEPPDYEAADIASWSDALAKIREVAPSWSKLKDNKEFYEKNKSDVDRINSIIAERIEKIEKVVNRMQANEWLTEEEKSWMRNDEKLYDEQDALANKINDAGK